MFYKMNNSYYKDRPIITLSKIQFILIPFLFWIIKVLVKDLTICKCKKYVNFCHAVLFLMVTDEVVTRKELKEV